MNQRAFTLVELSIVLVILGLLIGGVLTGQSLIRAAEIRSIATQQARYITAVHTFRDKYFALPGDMTNAQSYWGIAHATPATCATTASTDSKTCNGDGDGIISNATGSVEWFRFWQHLANAGLIEGSYDGIPHGTMNFSGTAANSPTGRISSSLWYAPYWPVQLNSGNQMFDGVYGNVLQIGGITTNSLPAQPILKPEEAYNIDMKVDDGKPAIGKVVMRGLAASCADTTTSSTLSANYLLTNTALACGLVFRQSY